MRTLYFTISLILLAITELAAAAKIEAIDDITLTACLTTRIKFNQDALKPYQAMPLTLKIEDEANDTSYTETISFQNGSFSWEKAIPLGENLKFTLLTENAVISYPFYKETRSQLAKIVAPTQVSQADIEEGWLVRGGVMANMAKKEIPIAISKELLNQELLIMITSTDGKLLWQYYGKTDSKVLIAKIPANTNYNVPRIILSNTVCNK